ncbi:hypothetical protein ACIPEL_15280 [Streptomyces griseoviridis]
MPDPTADDLRREREQLLAEIREAHGVLKDLRQTTKDARHEIRRLMTDQISAELRKHVATGLDTYKSTLDTAIESATAAVMKRFDDIADVLMGEDKTSRRRGEASIPDLFKTAAALQRAEREHRR